MLFGFEKLTNRNMCCRTQRDWKMTLEVIADEGEIERKPYHVEVEDSDQLACYCFSNGIHTLKVNGKIYNNEIYDNLCFPLCCVGGAYEWHEQGHYFRLELPSLFIHEGLYVDGRELSEKRLNITEWKNHFILWLVLGIIVTFIGLVFFVLNYSNCCWKGFLFFGICSVFTGFLVILPGALGLYKTFSLIKKYGIIQTDKRAHGRDLITII